MHPSCQLASPSIYIDAWGRPRSVPKEVGSNDSWMCIWRSGEPSRDAWGRPNRCPKRWDPTTAGGVSGGPASPAGTHGDIPNRCPKRWDPTTARGVSGGPASPAGTLVDVLNRCPKRWDPTTVGGVSGGPASQIGAQRGGTPLQYNDLGGRAPQLPGRFPHGMRSIWVVAHLGCRTACPTVCVDLGGQLLTLGAGLHLRVHPRGPDGFGLRVIQFLRRSLI